MMTSYKYSNWPESKDGTFFTQPAHLLLAGTTAPTSSETVSTVVVSSPTTEARNQAPIVFANSVNYDMDDLHVALYECARTSATVSKPFSLQGDDCDSRSSNDKRDLPRNGSYPLTLFVNPRRTGSTFAASSRHNSGGPLSSQEAPATDNLVMSSEKEQHDQLHSRFRSIPPALLLEDLSTAGEVVLSISQQNRNKWSLKNVHNDRELFSKNSTERKMTPSEEEELAELELIQSRSLNHVNKNTKPISVRELINGAAVEARCGRLEDKVLTSKERLWNATMESFKEQGEQAVTLCMEMATSLILIFSYGKYDISTIRHYPWTRFYKTLREYSAMPAFSQKITQLIEIFCNTGLRKFIRSCPIGVLLIFCATVQHSKVVLSMIIFCHVCYLLGLVDFILILVHNLMIIMMFTASIFISNVGMVLLYTILMTTTAKIAINCIISPH